jgi:hypothetical protein
LMLCGGMSGSSGEDDGDGKQDFSH